MTRVRFTTGLLILTFLSILISSGYTAEKSAFYLPGGAINVKEFGAIGDGVADDTTAIQRALDAVSPQIKRLRLNYSDGWNGGRNENAFPEVVFPSGIYRLTRTLLGSSNLFLRGSGEVTLRQEDPAQDILYQHNTYRFSADNLIFCGGFIALHFGILNTDASRVVINRCKFENSSQAIRCHSYRDPDEKGKPRPDFAQNANKNLTHNTAVLPYTIERDDHGLPVLTRVDTSNMVKYYNSTILIVRNSEFKNCAQVLNLNVDGTIMENCQIEAAPESSEPIFMVGGKNEFYRLTANAAAGKTKVSWFKSDSSGLTIRESSFTSEQPMALVYHDQTPPNWRGASITVQDNQFHAAGNSLDAVVYIEKQANIVVISGNKELSYKSVKALAWQKTDLTPEDFLAMRFFTRFKGHEQELYYAIDRNDQAISAELPAAAKLYAAALPPLDALERVKVAVDSLDANKLDSKFTRIIDALDFGLVGDGKTDDSAAINAALTEAAKYPDARVILPGRQMLIGKSLKLPANAALVGAGSALLVGVNQEIDLLVVDNPEAVFIHNLGIIKAANGITISGGTTNSQIVISENLFYDCAKWLVQTKGNADASGSDAAVLLRDNVLYGRIQNWARSFEMISNWHCMDMFIHEQAVVENRAGAMYSRSTLGVPICLKGNPVYRRYPKEQKETRAPWPYGAHQRWFDNYASLHTVDMRYGGEGHGMVGVHICSPQATLLMEGGYAHYNNSYSDKCQVLFQTPAKEVVIYNMRNYPFTEINIPGMENERQMTYKALQGVELDLSTIHISAVSAPDPQRVGLDIINWPDQHSTSETDFTAWKAQSSTREQ